MSSPLPAGFNSLEDTFSISPHVIVYMRRSRQNKIHTGTLSHNLLPFSSSSLNLSELATNLLTSTFFKWLKHHCASAALRSEFVDFTVSSIHAVPYYRPHGFNGTSSVVPTGEPEKNTVNTRHQPNFVQKPPGRSVHCGSGTLTRFG